MLLIFYNLLHPGFHQQKKESKALQHRYHEHHQQPNNSDDTFKVTGTDFQCSSPLELHNSREQNTDTAYPSATSFIDHIHRPTLTDSVSSYHSYWRRSRESLIHSLEKDECLSTSAIQTEHEATDR